MTGMLPGTMPIGSVSGLGGNPRIAGPETLIREAGSESLLDREAFLKLLVAQLRHQDPSKPVDSSQLISQSAQLSMVDKLSEIAKMLQTSAATERLATAGSIVGKEVSFYGPDGFPMTGTVSHVRFEAGEMILGVGGWDVPIDALLAVFDTPDLPAPPPPAAPPTPTPGGATGTTPPPAADGGAGNVPLTPPPGTPTDDADHPGAPPIDPTTDPSDTPPPTGTDPVDPTAGASDPTQPQETTP